MTSIEHQTFEDATIFLDDKYFIGCSFERCTLIYTGGDFTFQDCKIGVNVLRFEGAAIRMAKFMFYFGKMTKQCAMDLGFIPREQT